VWKYPGDAWDLIGVADTQLADPIALVWEREHSPKRGGIFGEDFATSAAEIVKAVRYSVVEAPTAAQFLEKDLSAPSS